MHVEQGYILLHLELETKHCCSTPPATMMYTISIPVYTVFFEGTNNGGYGSTLWVIPAPPWPVPHLHSPEVHVPLSSYPHHHHFLFCHVMPSIPILVIV
jgi:hypothetical protein